MSSTTTSRRSTTPKQTANATSPLANAALLAVAFGYGLWLLVDRGRLSWPPHELFAGIHTVAGCLAIVGPIILARKQASDHGLGELTWMTGGLLVWVNDFAALVRGVPRDHSWVTPLGAGPMGLTILAVLLAGWRLRANDGGRSWSWTNVIGWLLGVFWIGLGLSTLLPTGLMSRFAR